MGAYTSTLNDAPESCLVYCSYEPLGATELLMKSWFGGDTMAGRFVKTDSSQPTNWITGKFQEHSVLVKFENRAIRAYQPLTIEIDNFSTWQEAFDFFNREIGGQLNDHGFKQCWPGQSHTSPKLSLGLTHTFFGFKVIIVNEKAKGWVLYLLPGEKVVKTGGTDGSTEHYSMKNDVHWGIEFNIANRDTAIP